MADLLKCPFCGGEAELNYIGSCIPLHFVSCKECGCKQASSIHKEAVIEAWNTRKPMEAVVAELESIKTGGDCRHKCKHYDWSVGWCEGNCEDYVRETAISIVRGKE